jgi:DNA-binding transcriptional MerR regulator
VSGKEYTHRDLSRLLGVSETTIKSYRRKFPGCIPVAGYGKPIRFGEDALRVARRIRDLFEHGLSVGETRARLTGEFDWIAPERAEADERQPAREEDETRRPDPNALLAGLARSMVDVFLSQREIIKRLDALTVRLQAMPATSAPPASPESAGRPDAPEGGPGFGETDGRYDSPDARTAAACGASTSAASAPGDSPDARTAAAAGHACRILPLHGPEAAEFPGADVDAVHVPARSTIEPPRRFLALPLVAAAGNGEYIGAGGRKRGRFSLNDLKALFVFSFAPPRHFRFLWEEREEAWMLRLEQDRGGRRIRILLEERSLRGGGAAVAILSLEDNDEDLHPAEICAVIESLGD